MRTVDNNLIYTLALFGKLANNCSSKIATVRNWEESLNEWKLTIQIQCYRQIIHIFPEIYSPRHLDKNL